MTNIVLTGASSKMGLVTIKKFLQKYVDCKILCITRNANSLYEQLERVNINAEQILVAETDLSNTKESKDRLYPILESIGSIDILVNIAGFFHSKPFLDTCENDFDMLVGCNLKTIYSSASIVVPYMLSSRHGNIVNISSALGLHTINGSNNVVYDAVKAAVIQFTKSLAKELGRSNIRVNCICPGILHPSDDNLMGLPYEQESINKIMRHLNHQPLQFFGSYTNVADAIAFLSSEESSWTTGAVLSIDGGIIL